MGGCNPSVKAYQSGTVEAIAEQNGSLTYTDNDITLYFLAEVLKGIGYAGDIELSVEKTIAKESGSAYVVNGSIYEITLTINGKPYTGMFNGSVPVYIEKEVPSNVVRSTISVIYISEDGTIEDIDFEFDGWIVSFEVKHFSLYAVDYNLEAKVAVDLKGGRVASLNEGWTVSGGRYVKDFPLGTTTEEIVKDLGTVEKSNCMITSVNSSAAILTEDGMTVTVEWINTTIVIAVAIALLFALLLLIISLHSRKTRS